MDVTSYFGYILTRENAIYNYFDFKIFKSNFYSFTSQPIHHAVLAHLRIAYYGNNHRQHKQYRYDDQDRCDNEVISRALSTRLLSARKAARKRRSCSASPERATSTWWLTRSSTTAK